MFVLHFLLLLVPLVLFHELGHFLVARWMGVRVLSFSIGMGPVVAEWRRGGTQYALRALPIGGFVHMLGEDRMGEDADAPSDGPPPPDSFAAKAVWRRALIVAAGPIANFILPVVILFVGSLAIDGQVVSGRIGTVLPGGPAAKAGLRTGDRLVSVDGEPIRHFRDLQTVVSARPAKTVEVAFERGGERQTTQLTTDARTDAQLPELGLVGKVGRIQVLPATQAAIVAVDPGSPAAKAGIRSGDRVWQVGATETPGYWQLERALSKARGQTLTVEVSALLADAGPLHERKGTRKVQLAIPAEGTIGLRPAEAVIGRVAKDSPGAEAGLKPGDELLSVDGDKVTNLFDVSERLRKPFDEARGAEANLGLEGEELIARLDAALSRPFALKVRRITAEGAVERSLSLRLHATLDKRDKIPQLRHGLTPAQRYEPPEMIANPDRLGYAWAHTRDQMTRAIKVTALTVVGLFRGRVPMKQVGGPIFMAQMASRTAELGWGYFFNLMVWLSINLAILNLLPIPLVDGGHLLFLAIEAVKREPVSLRARMFASYVGFAFLIFVFVLVMKNDLQRVITSAVN